MSRITTARAEATPIGVAIEEPLLTRPIMLRSKQAALLTGLSEDYLRRSDCPRVELRGTGAKDKRRIIGYLYADVVAWLQRHRK